MPRKKQPDLDGDLLARIEADRRSQRELEKQAEQERSQWQELVLALLEAAHAEFRDDSGILPDTANREIARAWAPLWIRGARAVRDAGLSEHAKHVPLPDAPGYACALRVFNLALDGGSVVAVEAELLKWHEALVPRLADDHDRRWALRRFWDLLREHLGEWMGMESRRITTPTRVAIERALQALPTDDAQVSFQPIDVIRLWGLAGVQQAEFVEDSPWVQRRGRVSKSKGPPRLPPRMPASSRSGHRQGAPRNQPWTKAQIYDATRAWAEYLGIDVPARRKPGSPF